MLALVSLLLVRTQLALRILWLVPPPKGIFKLNVDGSSLGYPGEARIGGVIGRSDGSWVVGFSRKIGVATNNMPELGAQRWTRDSL